MKKKQLTSEQMAIRISVLTIVVNILLSAFKIIAGTVANSGAMISDAVHSLSDVLSTFIVIAGIKISNKASDENHQYGHERIECAAAVILSALLAATGIGIGMSGTKKIFSGSFEVLAVPGLLALLAAIVSIVVKEAMYWYTRSAAKRTGSGSLMADAWHHRSDAFSSVGSFAGILGARLGLPVLDPIASVLICVFIIKAAFDIFMDSIRKMTDESCDAQMAQRIRELALSQKGVLGIDKLQTRVFGNKLYVDLEIAADAMATLNEAHFVAEATHNAIENEFPMVKHCMVHVNPVFEDDIRP